VLAAAEDASAAGSLLPAAEPACPQDASIDADMRRAVTNDILFFIFKTSFKVVSFIILYSAPERKYFLPKRTKERDGSQKIAHLEAILKNRPRTPSLLLHSPPFYAKIK
jgi:hypothetical protein